MRTTVRALLLASSVVACNSRKAGTVESVPRARVSEVATCNAPSLVLGAARHGEIHVRVYLSTGKPEWDAYAKEQHAKLERWRTASGGELAIEVLDPAKAPAARDRAKEDGVDVGAAGEDGVFGLAVEQGTRHETVKRITPRGNGLEVSLAAVLRKVVETAKGPSHRIGVVVGHDEDDLAEARLVPRSRPDRDATLKSILLEQWGIELVPVDLSATDSREQDIAALLVTQPRREYADSELRRIDELVLRGIPLVVVASAVDVAPGDPTMLAHLATHGLEKLLGGYGVTLHRDVVLDWGSPLAVSVETQDNQKLRARFPMVVDVHDDLDNVGGPFSRVDHLYLPFASSLGVDTSVQPGATIRVRARSTAHASHDKHESVSLAPFQHWTVGRTSGQRVLAVTIEGTLRSAFGAERSTKSARVAVVASSQMLTNPFVRAAGPHGSREAAVLEQLAGEYAGIAGTSQILAAHQLLHTYAVHGDDLGCLEGR